MPLTESQAFHAWAARQPSTRERLRAFWSHWFRKENPHMSDKHDHVEMLGDLPDTAPENPRNTPPPRTAWSQDPWPGVRGTTTRPLPDVAWDPNLKTEDSVDIRPESPFTDADLSILTEAHGLVHGDRQASYGHPAVDFSRTAALVNTLLASKLKSDLGPEDIATLMVCVKLSRECHEHKRDNLVDACGYLECRERVLRFLGTASRTSKDAL